MLSLARGRRALSRISQAAVVVSSIAASCCLAQAQNEAPSNVNVLNLLSPFLTLNSTTYSASVYPPAGPGTLSANLSQAISINNGATTAQQQLAISDENLLSAATNTTIPGLVGTNFGVAANLGGGLPMQTISTSLTPATIIGMQNTTAGIGGLGTTLGAYYVTGVGSSTTSAGPLDNVVNLLVSAYNFTSSDLGKAKDYFANGTTNGTTVAVAPAGYTLPTFDGLPNKTTSVYDSAYGVTNLEPGQNVYGDSRPYQVAPGRVTVYDPTAPGGLNTNPSFPSGHTNYAYTDSILIGMMVPQEYQAMLSRASEYANSRIVLGVHYPLDIIGSRSFASYDLAQALSNPLYINNATTTGTAINLPGLLNAAAPQLQGYLSTQCGGTVANCATNSANTTNNPYVPSTANAQAYEARLTYGLPVLTFAEAPRQAAPSGGLDAAILLAPLFGGSTSAALTIAPSGGIYGNLQTSTIDQIIVNTETNALAAFYGTTLSYWSRIDLYAAAGYFGDVSGTITLAPGDAVNSNVVVSGATTNVNGDLVPAGVLAGYGTINGNVTINAGGTIRPGDGPGILTINGNYTQHAGGIFNELIAGLTAGGGYSQLKVSGLASLDGALDVTVEKGFSLAVGDLFAIILFGSESGDFASFYLNGGACTSASTDLWSCGGYKFSEQFAGGALDLVVTATPLPSTWSMMLIGLTGLAYVAYRQRRRGAALPA
jgi:subtilase-type serine protease